MGETSEDGVTERIGLNLSFSRNLGLDVVLCNVSRDFGDLCAEFAVARIRDRDSTGSVIHGSGF